MQHWNDMRLRRSDGGDAPLGAPAILFHPFPGRTFTAELHWSL